MTLLLSILAWLGIVLAGLLLLILFMPIKLEAVGSIKALGVSGRVCVRWAFGFLSCMAASGQRVQVRLLGFPIHSFKPGSDDEKSEEKKQKKKQKKQKKAKKGLGFFVRHRKALIGMFLRVLKAFHLRGQLSGVVGLGDPAVMAWLHVVGLQVPLHHKGFVWDVQPDYLEEVLDLQGSGQALFWPVQFGFIFLLFFLSRRTRSVMRASG
jgi:hypothetical protein